MTDRRETALSDKTSGARHEQEAATRGERDAAATAIIALGANLGDAARTLDAAVDRMHREAVRVRTRSRWIRTAPLVAKGEDAAAHPPYCNGVVVLDTALCARRLLATLHAIEREFGRVREEERARWQPRALDLDIIALGTAVIDEPDLRVPHPEMHRRRFVLAPLVEVWPDWHHPILNLTAKDLLEALDADAP